MDILGGDQTAKRSGVAPPHQLTDAGLALFDRAQDADLAAARHALGGRRVADAQGHGHGLGWRAAGPVGRGVDPPDLERFAKLRHRALVPIDGKLCETEPKTKRGRRLIALDAETVAVLREQAARQLGEQQALGDDWIDSGRVFTQENGAQLHPERISALFRRLVVSAALPPIPLHGLRHTYASLALAKGVNAAIVSRRLGQGHTNYRFAHAARSYSWISPPRMSRRRSCAVETNATGSLPSPCGTRRPSPRWGRLAL